MSPIVYGAILPHPPALVPEVGRERSPEISQTKKSVEEVVRRINAANPDTLLVLTPHGEAGFSTVHVYTSHVYEGSFSPFGTVKPVWSFKGDAELARQIVKRAQTANHPVALLNESVLDHGTLVPLYFAQAGGVKKPIVPMAIATLTLRQLFRLGESVQLAIVENKKRVAVIASAELSHRLSQAAPHGYDPAGEKFDREVCRLIQSYDVDGLLDFDMNLVERAAPCGIWSIALLFGILKGLKVQHELHSYEGPFGVGTLVASFDVKGNS